MPTLHLQRECYRRGAGSRSLLLREQLGGEFRKLERPCRYDRVRAQRFYRGVAQRSSSVAVVQRLKEKSRRTWRDLFMTSGSVNVLLWRHSGQEDLLVGTKPFAKSQSR
jgi:hypothetical protein